MRTKLTKKGDAQSRNDLISLLGTDDDGFGKHIHDEEGQLTLDVYQTDTSLVIIAPVAGVDPEKIDITVSDKEVITIRGNRSSHSRVREEDYLTQECFWGSFSRSIVLPDGLDVDTIQATFSRGVLKIEIPKVTRSKSKKVKIKKS